MSYTLLKLWSTPFMLCIIFFLGVYPGFIRNLLWVKWKMRSVPISAYYFRQHVTRNSNKFLRCNKLCVIKTALSANIFFFLKKNEFFTILFPTIITIKLGWLKVNIWWADKLIHCKSLVTHSFSYIHYKTI